MVLAETKGDNSNPLFEILAEWNTHLKQLDVEPDAFSVDESGPDLGGPQP